MKRFLSALCALLALVCAATGARAQQPPVPPLIRIVVPFAPGASTDVIARLIANQLGPRLGTNVIVENRAGGSGMIGSLAVVKGPKDGSMLLFTSVSMLSTAATTRNVPFDVTRDLVPIAVPGTGPLVIAVSSKTDIHTPADLVAAARARPGQLTHGTGGVGTIAHLAAELLNDAANIQLTHVPYKGAAPAVADTAGGTIDMMLAAKTTFAAQVTAGRMRLVAVTSEQPSPAFPGLPTMASVAPGYAVELWTALFAPAGTPPALVQRLNREVNEIAHSREMVELMQSDGATPLNVTPDEAAQRVRDAYATWKRLAAAKNIVLE
ncbi:tripartite tricarboxylate transporter substrate binding protein [Pseudorhodoferax sp.]|uniref:tripartite tricarboxylate transporter substrate binding protein n=1 Tax=Pseudorhodoferax sp. TaxID=1993553 RepID=UPI0039E57917